MSSLYSEIAGICDGSDGEATTALYRRLEAKGPLGIVAERVAA